MMMTFSKDTSPQRNLKPQKSAEIGHGSSPTHLYQKDRGRQQLSKSPQGLQQSRSVQATYAPTVPSASTFLRDVLSPPETSPMPMRETTVADFSIAAN